VEIRGGKSYKMSVVVEYGGSIECSGKTQKLNVYVHDSFEDCIDARCFGAPCILYLHNDTANNPAKLHRIIEEIKRISTSIRGGETNVSIKGLVERESYKCSRSCRFPESHKTTA
jgi:hypothetical protein